MEDSLGFSATGAACLANPFVSSGEANLPFGLVGADEGAEAAFPFVSSREAALLFGSVGAEEDAEEASDADSIGRRALPISCMPKVMSMTKLAINLARVKASWRLQSWSL
jgi:hypothetical protein